MLPPRRHCPCPCDLTIVPVSPHCHQPRLVIVVAPVLVPSPSPRPHLSSLFPFPFRLRPHLAFVPVPIPRPVVILSQSRPRPHLFSVPIPRHVPVCSSVDVIFPSACPFPSCRHHLRCLFPSARPSPSRRRHFPSHSPLLVRLRRVDIIISAVSSSGSLSCHRPHRHLSTGIDPATPGMGSRYGYGLHQLSSRRVGERERKRYGGTFPTRVVVFVGWEREKERQRHDD